MEQLLTMEEAVAAVENAFLLLGQGRGDNKARQRPRLERSGLQVMAAALEGVGMGLKAYTISERGARFVVLLWAPDTGDLLAMIEADKLGQMRTGAATGVATRCLSRSDSSTVGIIGSGWQARSQLEAVCLVRPIRSSWVYSPNP
ncbi:MAG TPA: ornithine cyclodeaminase family protein, partial [Spirochaetia bacterium]|nr:ornithine cyclodeaminase family protein [Spirochaetia bacterium]